jgi:hypothetical protein
MTARKQDRETRDDRRKARVRTLDRKRARALKLAVRGAR